MNKTPLDIYEDMPEGMKRYINNFGWHFNKKAYEYATSFMSRINPITKKEEKVDCYTKEQVDKLLEDYNINVKNKVMYDYVYVASMCKADYLSKSVPDKEHLAMFVRDTVDDFDTADTTTFRRWVATMVGNGNPIDWYEIC